MCEQGGVEWIARVGVVCAVMYILSKNGNVFSLIMSNVMIRMMTDVMIMMMMFMMGECIVYTRTAVIRRLKTAGDRSRRKSKTRILASLQGRFQGGRVLFRKPVTQLSYFAPSAVNQNFTITRRHHCGFETAEQFRRE